MARKTRRPAQALKKVDGEPDARTRIGVAHLETILESIRTARNFDFRHYKRPTLQRRIARRMQERGCASYADYLDLLQREPEEFDALISSMLVKVTSFFRDPEVWAELKSRIIPAILANKRPNEELRVWCAGCATGEEAYSIAIAFAEVLGPAFASYELKVFGSDGDIGAVSAARRGVYGEQQLRGVPRRTLERYFTKTGNTWAVNKEIRRVVVFGLNNLVSDAPISRLDLILCRNVFIYLDAKLQREVLTRLHYALKRNGVLVLGKSELIPFAGRIFEALDLQRRVYRKQLVNGVTRAGQERVLGLVEQETLQPERREALAQGELGHFFHQALEWVPQPVIVTALDGTVLVWNQAAARLWARPEAETLGKKLVGLALPGLSGDLLVERTAAVREGRRERESAEGLLTTKRGSVALTVDVVPIRTGRRTITGLVYLAHDVTALRALEVEHRRVAEDLQRASERLQTVTEELQGSNEELETTNEELQSANEELQTTNEELQSTNEELETTNEELQSANSELDATNRELSHRTEEMNVLAAYQRTIIRSLSAGVVVVDLEGRVTNWNLGAERLLGVSEPEALGQPFWSLSVPALNRATMQRLRKLLSATRVSRIEQLQYELPTGGRGEASVAVLPLVESERRLGTVFVFEDRTREAALSRENAALKRPAKATRPKGN